MSINIYKGSILECDVDVIVNPANSFLMNGAGLAKIIEDCATGSTHNAYIREDWLNSGQNNFADGAYDEYMAAVSDYNTWKQNKRLIPYGGAVLSPPGALSRRFKGIIHAVGPIWGGGDHLEDELLLSAYVSSLDIAEETGFESIAFPAISAGIFRVPIEIVAEQAALAASSTTLDVTFALMDDEHVKAFEEALG